MLRIALLASLSTLALHAEDWPQWLGPRRDNSSAESFTKLKDPKPEWTIKAGEGNASPVVANGIVFIHEKVADKDAECVRALDAATGKPVWDKAYDRAKFETLFGNGPRATPVVECDTLFTLGITNLLIAWDAKTGKELWRRDVLKDYDAKPLFFGASASPLFHDGKIIVMVGGPKAGLAAYDAKTGEPSWHTEPMPASYAAPVAATVAKAEQIIALTGSHLAGFDPKTGKTLWKVPFKDNLNESSTTPVVIGETGVVCSSVSAGTMRIDVTSGKPAGTWKDSKITCYFSTPMKIDDGKHLLIVSGKASLLSAQADLYCVESATGKVIWTRPKVGKYHASLTRGKDGNLLLLDDSGGAKVLAPNLKEYEELGSMKLGEGKGDMWAHPAAAESFLYIRDTKSLKAYRIGREGRQTWRKPTMRTLITGGGGFIGSHLCERFLAEGHEVVCVDNFITGALANLDGVKDNPKFQFIGHDISFPLKIQGPIDNVLHFASPASPVDYLNFPIQTLKSARSARITRSASPRPRRRATSWPPPPRSTATQSSTRSARTIGATSIRSACAAFTTRPSASARRWSWLTIGRTELTRTLLGFSTRTDGACGSTTAECCPISWVKLFAASP